LKGLIQKLLQRWRRCGGLLLGTVVQRAALNQRLSLERARNVTNFMEQQGNIPLTNILSPGAMGTSRQVAPSPDETAAEGQADNRRVVVRILQNKGIAGP
jgi:OmpA-OmpF porin, OOP family